MDSIAQSTCTIYLIHHAQSLANPLVRYDVPPGPALAPAGRLHAAMAAGFMRAPCPNIVYTSPLERAWHTAYIIGQQLDIPLALDERLAKQRHGESAAQVAERVAEFWQERIVAAAPYCIALVSHREPLGALLLVLDSFDCRLPPAGVWRASNCPPAPGWRVDFIFQPLAH